MCEVLSVELLICPCHGVMTCSLVRALIKHMYCSRKLKFLLEEWIYLIGSYFLSVQKCEHL